MHAYVKSKNEKKNKNGMQRLQETTFTYGMLSTELKEILYM